MKNLLNKTFVLVFVLILSLIFSSCAKRDVLERIKESGEIIVLTRNNAHCYYDYRESFEGFEYDLAKAFSEYLGVKLKVITPTWNGLFSALEKGEGDFIAASMTVTPTRKKVADFSVNYLTIQQRVIIHKDNNNINELDDLAGKTIHVRRGTSYEERLKELKDEGLDINIELHDDIPTEELIRMVAEKEIEIIISDSNIALLNRRYYPTVQIAFPIEEEQSLGWGVKKGEERLLKEINRFLKKVKDNGAFAKIYEKYYANVEIFDYIDLRKYHQRIETILPQYQSIIKEAADQYGFDWRLIAAVVYQESHFDLEATSYTGVKGIMQLTQTTAEEMDITDRLDPEQSIRGGVKYLRNLYDLYDTAREPDRTLITLASYNVGRGHVLDAQKISETKGFDPNSWVALEQVLPLLRYPKYYKDTKHGYCRGSEPVRYINRILTYYDILKRKSFEASKAL
ncbi:membrane-bound lytic murein transglycosylase MltF [Thermodesulfobacteriota bacterium]